MEFTHDGGARGDGIIRSMSHSLVFLLLLSHAKPILNFCANSFRNKPLFRTNRAARPHNEKNRSRIATAGVVALKRYVRSHRWLIVMLYFPSFDFSTFFPFLSLTRRFFRFCSFLCAHFFLPFHCRCVGRCSRRRFAACKIIPSSCNFAP